MEQALLFYRNHLKDQILTFWDRSFDETYGGVFTCYSNDGKKLLSQDKYTWSQARMLWCLSYLLLSPACQVGLSSAQLDTLEKRAHALYAFLHAHVLLSGEHEVCAFLLDRFGNPKEPIPNQGYYTSFYADCFVIMAYARYARLAKDPLIADEALSIYRKLERVLEFGIIRTEPYVLDEGTEAQSVYMILCNTAHELALCLKAFGRQDAFAIEQQAKEYAITILDKFVDDETMQLREIIKKGGKQDSLLERHCNPGHSLECMWFCLDVLDDQYTERIGKIMKASLHLGWDTEYKGLLRYVDMHGGRVQGTQDGSAFSALVAQTWDYKLWWPHAEALYASLRLFSKTGDAELEHWYQLLFDYTFRTFPSQKGEEWIQIRTRDGQPVDTVVALPVKDPYHIFRMLLLTIELLDSQRKDKEHGI
jgi:N-acylglucosamine 2-epimerase